jgi:hypothetical protein
MNRSPRIIEYYRADAWPAMRRVLVAGPVVLTLGALVIAFSFLTRPPHAVRLEAGAFGFVLIAAGALATAVGMQRILRDELFLALRSDGVVIQSPAGETLVGWDDLRAARWEADRAALVLERRAGDPIVLSRPFSRIAGRALAERILAVKRKAAMNLLA